MIPTTRCWLAPGSRPPRTSPRPQLQVREDPLNISNIPNILASMVFHTPPTARPFTPHQLFMYPDRSSMHFHALPPLFHRSSIALPSFFHHRSSRMGLRLILRGGGCNRAPLLLFSFTLLTAHPPTAFRNSLFHSSSFLSSFHRVPSLVSSVFPCWLFRLCLRLFVRSFVATALDRSTSRSSTLCVVPSKVSRPASAARLPALRSSLYARMRVCARHSPSVVHQRCVLCRPSHHLVIHTRSSFDP